MALQLMRRNMRYLKLVLWIVIIAFVALFGMEYQYGANANPRVAATVGGEEISTEEVRSAFRRYEDRYRQILGDQWNREMATQYNLVGQALQEMVSRKVLLLEARNLGLEVTDTSLRDEITSYPVFQDDFGRFIGEEEYRRWLRNQRLTPDAFEQDLREGVMLEQLDTILSQTAYVSDQELEAIYREQAEKAKIRYLQLPATRYTNLSIEQAELQAYFDERQTEYELPEQRVVDYLLVDSLQLRREIEVPTEEIRAYYDENPDEYTREEQVRARHILLQLNADRNADQARSELTALRGRIEAGEDFAALAREHSDEPDSAQRGGNLGTFGRNAWADDFTEVVFGAEAGTLVGPIETQYGFHLIEVQDHTPGGLRPFEQVSATIQTRLVAERANELAETKARDIAQRLSTISPLTAETFTQTAEEEGLVLTTTPSFGARDAVQGIGRGPFPEVAFALAEDVASEAVKVPRGWAILRLSEIKAPRVPELSEVENQVRPAVLREKQNDAALAELRDARARLDAGSTLDELAASLGVEPQESADFDSRGAIGSLGRLPEVAQAALALDEGQFGGPFADNQGGMLFEVVERQRFDPATFEDEKDSTRATEEAQRLNRLRSSLIELRIRDLDVSYNPRALELFGLDPSQLGRAG